MAANELAFQIGINGTLQGQFWCASKEDVWRYTEKNQWGEYEDENLNYNWFEELRWLNPAGLEKQQ